MDCEFCGKHFCSKYTLQTHQKTTKSCLLLQPEKQQLSAEEFICQFCLQEFSKKRFDSHVKNCKERKDKLILQLQLELQESKTTISELQTKVMMLETQLQIKNEHIQDIRMLANKSSKTPVQKQFPILETTPETINKAVIPHLTDSVIKGGYKAVIKCIADNYLKDDSGRILYKCSDPSRRVFQYNTDKNEVVKDKKCTKLLEFLKQSSVQAHCDSLIKSNKRLFESLFDSNYLLNFTTLFKNDDVFSAELTKHLV